MNEDIYDSDTEQGEVRWVNLTPTDRRDMMQFVFEDDDWYDAPGKYYEGGDNHPRFDLVAKKTGAPIKEVKRYYNAFLKKHGHDGKDVFTREVSRTVIEPQSNTIHQNAPQISQAPMPQITPMVDNSPDPMESMMMNQMQQGQGNSEASNMMFMMHFLTSQQRMQMQQQQFQAQLMMQQRQGDQQREADMRREQMARDQQFMTQQTTLLRESFKRANDGGIGGKLQQAYEEKMIDEIVNGGKSDGWRDDVKDILTSDTLKEAVTGLGSALTSRAPQVPVGYDAPNYNPYAQPIPAQPMPTQVPQQLPPQPYPQQAAAPPAPQQEMDGVFFEQQPNQPIAQQQPPAEMTSNQYQEILLDSFSQLLGPAMQDEQVAKAVAEQIEVAVEITLLEMPEALPQIKLQAMSEKLLLVRNLRDICFGLRDLRDRVTPGEAPGAIIMSAVTSELKKRPEFYNIFAKNTYEELVGQIEPFKDTGAVKYDYEYLLRPEVGEIARYLLSAVAQDSQSA